MMAVVRRSWSAARWRGQWVTDIARSLCRRADDGAITAEFSVVLPAVILVAAVLLSLCRAVVVTMDCQDAASAAARSMMIEQDQSIAVEAARASAGDQVSVSVSDAGTRYDVTVQCPVLPGPMHVIPASVRAVASVAKQ